MHEKNKISTSQFRILVTFYTIGSTILTASSGLVFFAKQDVWISMIIGTIVGLLIIWLYIALCNRLPAMTLIHINNILLGTWLGKIVSLLVSLSLFLAAAVLLYALGNFLTTQIMPNTPIEVINIIFALIIVQGVRLGIETIARAAELFFPVFIILFFMLIIFVSPDIDFQKIQPVFETGIKPIILATLLYLNFTSLPLITLLMIYPSSINQSKQASRAFFEGHIMGGIVLLMITLLSVLVLGADHSARLMYPSYALARKINVGAFIQRIEVILAILWFISFYFKITLYFYASLIGIAQTLNLKNYRPLTLPLGMILVVLSIFIYPNVTQYQKTTEVWTLHLLTIGLFLPLLLLGMAIVRKKRKNHGIKGD